MEPTTPDRLNVRVMLLIALVGAALALVGWYRFFATADAARQPGLEDPAATSGRLPFSFPRPMWARGLQTPGDKQ